MFVGKKTMGYEGHCFLSFAIVEMCCLVRGHYRTPTQTMHFEEKIHQNDHRFALFHSSNMGNLMTPVGEHVFCSSSGVIPVVNGLLNTWPCGDD